MQPEIHVHVHNNCCGDKALADRVTTLEELVTSFVDQLNALRATVVEANEDVQAALANLQAQIDAIGNPVEVQAALDAVKAAVQTGVDAVGDADGDGNPAPTPEPEPTPEPTP